MYQGKVEGKIIIIIIYIYGNVSICVCVCVWGGGGGGAGTSEFFSRLTLSMQFFGEVVCTHENAACVLCGVNITSAFTSLLPFAMYLFWGRS